MPLKVSLTNYADLSFNYLVTSTIKLPLINYQLTESKVHPNYPYNYCYIYEQCLLNLTNHSTLIINSPNTLSPYLFELLTTNLKNTTHFTSFNLPKNPHISDISNLITKLNPSINIFTKFNLIIKYYLLHQLTSIATFYNLELSTTNFLPIIKQFFASRHLLKTKTPDIIYNPFNLSLPQNFLSSQHHHYNHPVKLSKFKKYTNIYYLYEKYNPDAVVIYCQLLSYCHIHHLNLIIEQC